MAIYGYDRNCFVLLRTFFKENPTFNKHGAIASILEAMASNLIARIYMSGSGSVDLSYPISSVYVCSLLSLLHIASI